MNVFLGNVFDDDDDDDKTKKNAYVTTDVNDNLSL